MIKKSLLVSLLLLAGFGTWPAQRAAIRIGSKKFTESIILGEAARILVADAGISCEHLRELGGTRVVFDALVAGEIDVYVEYSGTLVEEILANRKISSDEALRAELTRLGIGMSKPLGFNNTYAIGMQRGRAAELGVTKISDLAHHPELRFGFGNEFMRRGDGWPGLQAAYQLAPRQVTGLDHDVAYQQLQLEVIDAVDVYTTDARIAALDLRVLQDDRNYFPRYDALVLYRLDTAKRFPAAMTSILRLERALTAAKMVRYNGQAELKGYAESAIAARMLGELLRISSTVEETSVSQAITQSTIEHLELVRRSLLPAILFGVPLGVFAAKRRRLGQVVLMATGVVQTIPSLALLVMLMPVAAWLGLGSVGVGSSTAILALFLYSLLPIVRGAHSGLIEIEPSLVESAEALGLSRWYRLNKIELPLASRSILSGIKTAAILNVGFATLGALVGAGGFGQPILSGIRLADTNLILQGAIPAALLAIAVQYGFELVELLVVPRGLRLAGESEHAQSSLERNDDRPE